MNEKWRTTFKELPMKSSISKSCTKGPVHAIVAFDGEAYAGWQRQANGISVQQKIEEALRQLCGHAVTVHGASRTDSGVHALAMSIHFEWKAERPDGSDLMRSLNALLPEDIRVLKLVHAKPDFHSRFDACSKIYRYRIFNNRLGDPFRRKVAWFIHRPLDLAAMKRAAKLFVGKKNFSAMAANPGYERTTMVRHIRRCAILKRGDEIHLEVEADGFLYKMVRTIVGTLVDVGLGRRSVESVRGLLKSKDRNGAGKTAPAHGLFLVRVNYQ